MTQEWVATDASIWDYDFEDDFIWVPTDGMYGVGTFVAKDLTWQFVADIEPFMYVAKNTDTYL